MIDKLELSKSSKSKVKEDLDKLFKEYKTIQKNNKKLQSTDRNLIEKIVIKKSSYSKFGKKLPLDEAAPRTQRRRLLSKTSTTTEIARKWHLLENRKPNDYKVRQGVTKEPITNEEHLTLHPLHSYLRVFGWIYKICYLSLIHI